MDCLAILKEFCLTGQLGDVHIAGDRVRFADKYSFPKQSPTAFKAKDGAGDYYSLEAVTFFIKSIVTNPNNMGAYVAAAVRSKVHQIELRDREPLRDYLTGKIQHTPHIADVVPVANIEPAPKRQRVDDVAEGEAAALKHLFEQEKQLRNRNSLLCAPGANFKPVLDMLDKVLHHRKAAEAAAAKSGGHQQQKPGQRPPGQQQQKPAMQFMKPSGRMERDDAGAGLLAQLGGDAAGIAANIGRGYGIQADVQKQQPPSAAAAAAAANPNSKPHQQQQQQQHRSSGKGPDPRAAAAAAGGKSSSHHQHHKGGGGGVAKHKDPPIILVPSGITAMFNIFNAKQFFEEGRFVPSAEAAAAANNAKPSQALEFQRTALRNGPRYPKYQVTDKVPRAGSPDWKRVVAVVVQGKPWQFKDFPYKGANKGDLMDTFTHLFGVYFHYADEPVPEAVNGWKVIKLPLRRTARHLDNTVMMDFYNKLDAFLQARKCELDY